MNWYLLLVRKKIQLKTSIKFAALRTHDAEFIEVPLTKHTLGTSHFCIQDGVSTFLPTLVKICEDIWSYKPEDQSQIHQLEKLQHPMLQTHWFIWNSQTHWPTYSWHVGYTTITWRSHRTLEWLCRVAILGVMMMIINATPSGWKAGILLTGQTCKTVQRSRQIKKKILGAKE